MGTVRFLLALSVVVTHSKGSALLGYPLFSGITAVQCFYVISGFLITMRLNEAKGYESAKTFYLSRYLRLWPAYFVVALLTLTTFKWNTMTSTLLDSAGWLEIAFIWFANATLFFQDWFLFVRLDNGHFLPTSAFGTWPGPQPYWFLIVPQAWTLGVELTFYAIAPFVCRRWWTVALLFAFGLASRLIVAHFNQIANDPWVYRFAPSEMMMFGAGGIAYFAGRHVCPRYPAVTKAVCGVSVLVFIVLTFGHKFIMPYVGLYFGYVNMTLLITYLPAIILMVATVAPLFYGTRKSRVDQELGELSYPMYISHLFVVQIFGVYVPVSLQVGNLLYVATVIAVSYLMVLLIIKPVDRKYRARLGARFNYEPLHGNSSKISVSA